jgi:hypothetical protein
MRTQLTQLMQKNICRTTELVLTTNGHSRVELFVWMSLKNRLEKTLGYFDWSQTR